MLNLYIKSDFLKILQCLSNLFDLNLIKKPLKKCTSQMFVIILEMRLFKSNTNAIRKKDIAIQNDCLGLLLSLLLLLLLFYLCLYLTT